MDLLLARQLLCDFVCLFQVFEITFDPVHFAGVAVSLELLDRFVGVFFLLREEEDLGGLVLEEMGRDAESDPCCAARDDVYLVRGQSAL